TEAIRAVDRLIAARLERHARLAAAGGARSGEELARAAAAAEAAAAAVAAPVPLLPALGAATGAAARLVRKAFLGVELLFPRREHERAAAVNAGKGSVCECHSMTSRIVGSSLVIELAAKDRLPFRRV